MLVIMALVTTFLTTPVLDVLISEEWEELPAGADPRMQSRVVVRRWSVAAARTSTVVWCAILHKQIRCPLACQVRACFTGTLTSSGLGASPSRSIERAGEGHCLGRERDWRWPGDLQGESGDGPAHRDAGDPRVERVESAGVHTFEQR